MGRSWKEGRRDGGGRAGGGREAAVRIVLALEARSSSVSESRAWDSSGFIDASVRDRSSVPYHCFTNFGKPV